MASLPFAIAGLSVPAAYAQLQQAPPSRQQTQKLQDALRRIASNSNDSSALADAGLAALELGDTRAAIGFLAKADQIYPRSGRVKAGLARALLLEENPFGAIRYFGDAVSNGISLKEIAADRGLAYDLIGRNSDAQKDYEYALRYGTSDELLARYAISLGISGNIEDAESKLAPLLRKSDRDAWRSRAFIYAMNGDEKEANNIAKQTMRKEMAKAIKPFFDRMPKLTSAQKAAAVHFGHFPASENIGVDVASVQYASNNAVRGGDGADSGLIPLGPPLGTEAEKPRVLAMPDTSPRRRPGSAQPQTKAEAKAEKKAQRIDRRADTNGRRPLGEKTVRTVTRTDVSQPGKIQVLETTSLPAPESARPLVKPAAKPAPATSVPAIVATQIKPEAGKMAAVQTPTPGFETPVAAEQKPAPLLGNTRTASLNEVPGVSTKSAPLVSETVERKVTIGVIPPIKDPNQPATPAALPDVKKPEIGGNKPVQVASFDLANTASPPAATTEAPADPVEVAQADVARKPLSAIIGAIDVSQDQRKTTVVPVDLSKITPAKPAPKIEPKPEVKKPEPVEKKEEHPKRYWVQIATGSNLNALKYDFRKFSKQNVELFKGNDGWTSPWGNTRRLVVGPFDDFDGAKKFEAGFRKAGGDGFTWVSAKGTEVNPLK